MQSVEFDWNGATYSITEDQVFEVVAELEEVITLSELAAMEDKIKFNKLASAFTVVLSFVGVPAKQVDVYRALMNDVRNGGENELKLVMTVVTTLVNILMGGSPEAEETTGDAKKKTKGNL